MRLPFLAALALAVSTVAAHADVIQNFALNTTLSNGTHAGGDVLFDETTGLFTGGAIYGSLGGSNYVFSNFGGSAVYDTVTYENLYDAAGDIFQVVIPGTKDAGYAGGSLCSSTVYTGCAVSGGSGAVYLTASSLTAGTNAYATSGNLAATPEPSSLALLGTGLLGLVGVARKRFA